MTLDLQAKLIADLRTLRKGRGLWVAAIGERVGPALRQACDIGDFDEPKEIRRKVAEWLEKTAASLPDDLRIGLVGATALDPNGRMPFYQDRVRWVAERIHRDDRTARRRIDEAIDRVAELAVEAMQARQAERPEQAKPGWYTEELRIAVAMDRPSLEVIESRRIVATGDDLDGLDLSMTVSHSDEHGATPDDLSVDVFHGGTLIHRRLESTSRIGLAFRLPRPLSIGQAHELMLRYQLTPGRKAQPHYVCVPKYRCDLFKLSVRFDVDWWPRAVQRISGLFQTDIHDPLVPCDEVQLDAAGEAHAVFRQLTPGMAYGLRWQSFG